jgi:bifunctional non-homologous end joining protein LigD
MTSQSVSRPISEALAELKRPAILDGEIVALDEKRFPRFEWLVRQGKQRGTLVYYVFDLLMLDGKDLRGLPLVKRKQRLERLLKNHPRLDHVETAGLAMFAGALALKLEGVVAKDSKSLYIEAPRATAYWQTNGRKRLSSGNPG